MTTEGDLLDVAFDWEARRMPVVSGRAIMLPNGRVRWLDMRHPGYIHAPWNAAADSNNGHRAR